MPLTLSLRDVTLLPMLKALAARFIRSTTWDTAWLRLKVPSLHACGWLRSRAENRCVDAAGRPIPWIPYPAIEFLARRTRADMAVFEYGCGASTLWWASRVSRVISVEHDAAWANDISARAPQNATVLHVPIEPEGAYARSVVEQSTTFDVVVIDGRDRVRCTPNAIAALKPEGVIVFDNSDREEYADAYQLLRERGFRKLELVGMAPMIDYVSETSVFYRRENCFGI